MKRTQFNIKLPQSHVNRIKKLCQKYKLTQSELIMRLVDEKFGLIFESKENDDE